MSKIVLFILTIFFIAGCSNKTPVLNKHKGIGEITKTYLKYPPQSVKKREEGTSIVEFVLSSNGKISNVKIATSSGFELLDNQAIMTVYEASIDYPRPKKETKVKVHVTFKLY